MVNQVINEEKLEIIKKEALKNHVPILKDVSLKYILTILEIRNPKTILEIGTAVGYSAINFSRYLDENGKITTIEINEETAKIAKENIKDMGLSDKIEVVVSDAYEYMKTLNDSFDVIFIDAAKGQYVKYLDEALRLSKKGSIIIADNVLLSGMVLGGYNEHKHRTQVNRLREYIEKVTTDEKLKSTIVDVGDGLAISVVQ